MATFVALPNGGIPPGFTKEEFAAHLQEEIEYLTAARGDGKHWEALVASFGADMAERIRKRLTDSIERLEKRLADLRQQA